MHRPHSPWLNGLKLRDEEVRSDLFDSADEQDKHRERMRDLRRLVCLQAVEDKHKDGAGKGL